MIYLSMKICGYSNALEWDTEDEMWVARVPELPGCMAHGDTQAEALKELQIAIPAWLAAAEESGFPFCPPGHSNVEKGKQKS